MIAALLLASILFGGVRTVPEPPGTVAKACGAGGCSYLAVQHGEVRGILSFTRGSIDADRDLGRYLGSAQALVPKTEAPIRELETRRGWRVVIAAAVDGPLFRLRAHFISPNGQPRGVFGMSQFLRYVRVGALFGGKDQIVLIEADDGHAYTTFWRAFRLPDHGYPELLAQGWGRILWAGTGAQPGIIVKRQHPVGGDANRVLSITEYWNWDPRLDQLVLAQH